MNFSEFYEYLSSFPFDKVVIIGLGNPNCGDDATGLFLFNQLKQNNALQDSHFIFAGRTPENYIHTILNYNPELVIFIDVIRQSRDNSIQLLDSIEIDSQGFTTHSYSITMVEEYLKNNNKMEIKYLAIPIEKIVVGESISKPVKARVNQFLAN